MENLVGQSLHNDKAYGTNITCKLTQYEWRIGFSLGHFCSKL